MVEVDRREIVNECESRCHKYSAQPLLIVWLPAAGAVIFSVLCSPSHLPLASLCLSLIRTPQQNTCMWALCVIHRSEAHSAACGILFTVCMLRKQVHNQREETRELCSYKEENAGTTINLVFHSCMGGSKLSR